MSAFDGERTMDSQGRMMTAEERRRANQASKGFNERAKKRAREEKQRARQDRQRRREEEAGKGLDGDKPAEDPAIDRGQGDPDQGSGSNGGGGGGGSKSRGIKGLPTGVWVDKRVLVNFSGNSVIVARYFATFRADPGTTWSLSSKGNIPARWKSEYYGLDFDTGAGEKLHGLAIGRDSVHEVTCEHVIISRALPANRLRNVFVPWGATVTFTATLFGGKALSLDEIAGTIQREWVGVVDFRAAAENPAGQ